MRLEHDLYPSIEPYATRTLAVDDVHILHLEEYRDLLGAYHRRLRGTDEIARMAAAKAWPSTSPAGYSQSAIFRRLNRSQRPWQAALPTAR